LEKIKKTPTQKMDGVSFEFFVFEQMCLAAKDTKFEGSIAQTGKQTFPDIIANKYFGIEVKVTAEDKWVSTGNSVAEGTRVDDVGRIYMFFGKLGGTPGIKFKPYQECLPEVVVTHSPRYKIDMELPKGKSIFDKMGVDYDSLRREKNPIMKVKEFLRKNLSPGEELWWIDNGKESTANIKIVPYKNLDKFLREAFITEAIVLFPEVLDVDRSRDRRNKKYQNAAAYLIVKHDSYNASFRDIFSGGGQKKVIIKNKEILVPKVIYKLFSNAKAIEDFLNRVSEEDLIHYWQIKHLKESRLKIWKRLLNARCLWREDRIAPFDVFEAGLK